MVKRLFLKRYFESGGWVGAAWLHCKLTIKRYSESSLDGRWRYWEVSSVIETSVTSILAFITRLKEPGWP
jgi:hypothetical protein